MSGYRPDASPFASVPDFSVPVVAKGTHAVSTFGGEGVRSTDLLWLKILTAAVIGLPLYYVGRTRLGAPIARRVLRALSRSN